MDDKAFSWKAKLFLIAFGISISLIACEIFLRFYNRPTHRGTEFQSLAEVRKAMLSGDSKQDGAEKTKAEGDNYESGNLRGLVVPHPDDDIIYDLIPNLETRFQRAQVKTNSCGMRSPERPVAKDPDVFRIAFLGDSFVFGWGVEASQGFPQILEDNLNRISGGNPRFEVLNFGTPGYSTFQEVAKFKETGLDFDPDAVIVFFIENDFGLPFYVKDIYNPGSILSSVSFAKLTWKAIDPKLDEQMLQMTSFDPNRALAGLAETLKKKNIPLYFTINPKKGWKGHLKRLWVLKEKKNAIRFINMREDFMFIMKTFNIPEKDLTLSHDPHPSPLRHRIYGDILTPHFMEYIR